MLLYSGTFIIQNSCVIIIQVNEFLQLSFEIRSIYSNRKFTQINNYILIKKSFESTDNLRSTLTSMPAYMV